MWNIFPWGSIWFIPVILQTASKSAHDLDVNCYTDRLMLQHSVHKVKTDKIEFHYIIIYMCNPYPQ